MYRNLLLILVCVVGFLTTTNAQSVFSGRVLENKTRIVLNGVIVENLRNKLKARTGTDGRFSIAANVGDLLVLRSFSYQPDTLLITDMHDREVFMQPLNTMLNQVNITDTNGHTSSAAKNMKYIDPEFHGQAFVPQRDINGDFKGGVALRLHYFTKDDNDKRKAASLEKDRAVREQISSVFTAENIGKYVPLKGQDMDNFILLFIPEVKTYTNHEFNLLTYLNECYKTWLTLSPDQKSAAQLIKN